MVLLSFFQIHRKTPFNRSWNYVNLFVIITINTILHFKWESFLISLISSHLDICVHILVEEYTDMFWEGV
jgi:hypothetical protein